jgi:methyl-accepting chemotaxis protein
MMKDDNQKIKTMKTLLHELEVCGQFNAEDLSSLGHRINQLGNIRYTPKTMYNADIVEEYDFASSSLVTELISLAESHTGYSYSKAIQHMVEEIRAADLRVAEYRNEYDAVAQSYNTFLDKNKELIAEIADNGTSKKPLFQMVSE